MPRRLTQERLGRFRRASRVTRPILLGMDAQAAALIVSSISAAIGLTTLALVIRNELRVKRSRGPILWSFTRYATRSDGLQVAELVQYGHQPTHVLSYHCAGFDVTLEEGYRLRAHVKAEDTLPLLLSDVDDRAWMLIGHYPRDDRRWLIFEWVSLQPESEAFRQEQEASWEIDDSRASRWRRRVARLRDAIPPASPVVRPVGPTGAPWAKVRADRGGDLPDFQTHISTICSLAYERTPHGGIRAS